MPSHVHACKTSALNSTFMQSGMLFCMLVVEPLTVVPETMVDVLQAHILWCWGHIPVALVHASTRILGLTVSNNAGCAATWQHSAGTEHPG